MRPAWILGAVLVAAAGAGLGLLVGGDDQANAPTSPEAARRDDVRFEGKRVPGTLYLMAGQDDLNADLYRASGSLGSVRRLTVNGRVSSVSAWDGKVAVANARGSGSDRLELVNGSAKEALPGRVVDPDGQVPSFSPRGRLLYQVQRYTRGGGAAGVKLYVADANGGGKRRVLSTRRTEVNAGWGPGERVAVVYGNKPRMVLDPGGRQEQTVRVRLRSVTRFETSVSGAIYAVDAGDRIAIIPPRGSQRVFESPWRGTLAWAPDGRSILVARDDRLGLMSPADGSVQEIGRVKNGEVFGAAWAGAENQETTR